MNMKKNKNLVNMKMKSKKTKKKKKKKKMRAKQTQYNYYKQIIFIGKKITIKINTKTTPNKLNMTIYIYNADDLFDC